ncbi:hypothetical protein CM49_00041 [Paenibacillus sp. P1XP2]|nr:hypothetical protein CM49_00041 [Paenibacillus sp. P1XP2]
MNGGIIGGILGGIGAGLLVQFLFVKCVQWRFPMTTVNIAAGGFAGLVSGLIMYYLVAPFALQAGEFIKYLINLAISFNPIVAGVIGGLLIWPAILGGVYHAAILPIVLLEMEKTGNSFLGAIDMVGLVMVSAGITLANLVAPRDKGEAAVAAPGFLINMGFGTFVEAATLSCFRISGYSGERLRQPGSAAVWSACFKSAARPTSRRSWGLSCPITWWDLRSPWRLRCCSRLRLRWWRTKRPGDAKRRIETCPPSNPSPKRKDPGRLGKGRSGLFFISTRSGFSGISSLNRPGFCREPGSPASDPFYASSPEVIRTQRNPL